jgi:hypothetical protein
MRNFGVPFKGQKIKKGQQHSHIDKIILKVEFLGLLLASSRDFLAVLLNIPK